nr:glutenin, high molecular weight subunit PW212-like [Vulpes vulpes]
MGRRGKSSSQAVPGGFEDKGVQVPLKCSDEEEVASWFQFRWIVCEGLGHEQSVPDIGLSPSGCLQELNPATCSSFGDPGHSEVKDLAQREERRQAEPTTQRPFIGLWGRKLVQGAPRPSGLPSQGLPEPQHLPQGPGWGLGQQRAELQKLLRIEILQRPREEDPQEQKEGCPRGQRGEAPRGENKEVPKRQGEQLHQGPSAEATQALREEVSVNPRGEPPPSERRESPQGQGGNRPECPGKEGKEVLREPRKETPQALQTCPRRLSQARGVDEGEVPTPSPEEGGSPGTSRDFHRSLGEQKPQPAGREGAGSGERTTQLTPGKTDGPRRESAPAGERRAERQAAPDPGGSGRRERPAALPGRARLPGAAPCGLLRAAGWEARASGLHTAQEDAARQRRALREQLQQVLRERTWRLRALGARNTQNFQQLLWPPGAEEPLPGEQRSPFPAPSSHS